MPGDLVVTVPHKHTIPAPEAAVELDEPVTLALICATAFQSSADSVRTSASTSASAGNRPTRRSVRFSKPVPTWCPLPHPSNRAPDAMKERGLRSS